MNASLLTASAVLVLSFSSLVLAQGNGDPSKGNASKEAASAKDGKGAASSADKKFMRDMLEADLAEVEAGKMASGKASDARVKQFAQHMVDDHGAGLKEGTALAKSKGIDAPSEPDKKHQDAAKKLQSMSGAAFDRGYMQQMVTDHQEALKMLQGAAKQAKDSDVKSAAQKKAPVVEEHLKMARETLASLRGDGKAKQGEKK